MGIVRRMASIVAVIGIVASVKFLYAAQDHKHEGRPDSVAKETSAYPLDICPVSDEKLNPAEKPVIVTHEGREVRFCCQDCVEKFNNDPDTYLKKMDDLIIKKLGPEYPLKTCLVSGEKLESPVDFVYKNRLVRFCCKDCREKFLASPDEYLKKLDEAGNSGNKGEAKPEEKKESSGHNHGGGDKGKGGCGNGCR